MNILRVTGATLILFVALLGKASAQIVPIAPVTLNTNATTDSGTDTAPTLVTDGNGIWIAAWESDDTLSATIGSDFDIVFARSTDNGNTWSSPAPLNSNAATDSGTDGSPAIACDGLGNWIAVWWSNDTLGGTIGSDRDVLFAQSSDDGQTWSAPQPLNANAATDTGNDFTNRSSIATNKTGTWLAVWQSTDSLNNSIGSDSDILFVRSTNNGGSWSAPLPLNSNAAGDTGNDMAPAIAGNASGVWFVVWESDDSLGGVIGNDFDLLSCRSQDNGTTWSSAAWRNSNAVIDSGDDRSPKIATDGGTHWVIVWQSDDSLGGTIGTDLDILVTNSSTNAKTWSFVKPLNANASIDATFDAAPHIDTDGDRNWITTWDSQDTLGGTIGNDTDVLVALSQSNGTSWDTPLSINTLANTDSATDTSSAIAAGAANRWLTTWYSDNTLSGTVGTDIDLLVTSFELSPALSLGKDYRLFLLGLPVYILACFWLLRRQTPFAVSLTTVRTRENNR